MHLACYFMGVLLNYILLHNIIRILAVVKCMILDIKSQTVSSIENPQHLKVVLVKLISVCLPCCQLSRQVSHKWASNVCRVSQLIALHLQGELVEACSCQIIMANLLNTFSNSRSRGLVSMGLSSLYFSFKQNFGRIRSILIFFKMDAQGIIDLRKHVLTQDPKFKNAVSQF